MRPSLRSCFALVTLVLAGCGGGDDGVSPEPAAPPLVSGTIDATGGELVDEEVMLAVPAGALGVATDLDIHREDAPPFGNGPVYRIEGLPENLGTPVVLSLRTPVAKAGETTVFLGEERDSYESGRNLSWFETTARDSAGWTVVELDRGAYVLDEEKAAASLQVAAADGLDRSPTSGGHYEIVYDPARTTAGGVALVAAKLEAAWNEVYALGFRWGEADIWPRPVYLRDIDHTGNLAQYTVAPYGKGHFELDPDALVNSLAMGIIIGHEVLHSAQDHFDDRPPSTWKTINTARLWLDEATASWFEEKFYPEDDSYPMSLNDFNYTMPVEGFAGRKRTSWATVGYGLSSLVKYVVDRQGEGRILEFYERFSEEPDGALAFQAVVDPPMEDWVADFFNVYVTGVVYPYLEDADLWLQEWPARSSLVGGDDHRFSESWLMWEMSAQPIIFTVTDDRDTPAEALKARHTSTDPIHISLFGLAEGQQPVLLGSARDSVLVDGLPGLLDAYDHFMVLPVRVLPYDPDTLVRPTISTEVELVEDDLARFETMDVWFRHGGRYLSGYQDQQLFFELDADIGSVRNHVYRAEWDSLTTGGAVHYAGQITVAIDPVTLDVTSWSASQRTEYFDNHTVNNLSISGGAVPLEYIRTNEYKWKLEGSAACGAVTSMDYNTYFDGELQNGLDSWWCNEESYVVLLLQDEE